MPSPWSTSCWKTDAYPQPFKKYRHNWTEPRHLAEVAECLAAVKGISVDEVAEITTANLSNLLRLKCSTENLRIGDGHLSRGH